MGCIQSGRSTIITVSPLLKTNIKQENLILTLQSPSNKKRSTLKEISKLASNSKDIKIKNFIQLIESRPTDDYHILKKLGKGSFGSVFKVKHKITGEIRAMKMIKNILSSNSNKIDNKFLREIQVLKNLEHPNIIKVYEYYIDEEYHYIITELVTGGELYDTIVKFQRFNEKKAAYIMRQILSALNYLHSRGIVHRDIKPENILVEEQSKKSKIKHGEDEINIKLIDFGASNYFKTNQILTLKIGSPYYIAPEVLNKCYNEKCDIWSAGVVLYVMLTGNFPFVGQTTQQLFENIKTGKYNISGKEYNAISQNAKDLIKQMLELNAMKRISASECLNSPFFSIINDNNDKIPDILPSVISNIYQLNAREKIQQATIGFIVHNIQQTEQVEKLKNIFEFLDINQDGELTYNEIKEAILKIFPDEYMNEEKINYIIDKMDENKDGVISYEEFLRVTIDEKILLEKSNLKMAFDKFDTNKDGKLSKEELANILDKGASEYVDSLLSLIDKNQDGFISFDEFCHLMSKVAG